MQGLFNLNSKISPTNRILLGYSLLTAAGLLILFGITTLAKNGTISLDVALLLVAGLIILFFLLSQPKNENPSSKNINLLNLSARENDVAALLSQGKDNKSIAQELFISENTVKTHIKKIYTKLEVNNRTQFVKIYLTEAHHPKR